MDVKKLATFVDLAATLSYTKTAERLFTTQATISKQVKALEQELDTTLINRSHRQIKLTQAGTLILPYADQIVASEREMTRALADQKQRHDMSLTIRAIPSISQYRAFNLIAAFSRQHPEVTLQFSEAETDTLLPSLRDGTSDVVFTRLFDRQQNEFETLLGETDRLAVVLPKTNPIAEQQTISIDMLKNESFLMLNEATNLYQPVMSLIKNAGFKPKVVYEGKRIDLILGMINRGMGLSVMMANSIDLTDYPAVKVVPLASAPTSHLAFLRLSKRHTPASDLFWSFVADQDL